jgi:hypothetical protein
VFGHGVKPEPGTEIYSMNVFPYEGQYIGLLQVFHARPEECTLDIQLTASFDGRAVTYGFGELDTLNPFANDTPWFSDGAPSRS